MSALDVARAAAMDNSEQARRMILHKEEEHLRNSVRLQARYTLPTDVIERLYQLVELQEAHRGCHGCGRILKAALGRLVCELEIE